MANIKCVACKGVHPTVSALKACHMANNALIADKTSTIKTTKVEKAKSYKLFTFDTEAARDAFIQVTPGAQVLTTSVKKVNVFNQDTDAYEMVVTKTFKVIVK
jgi:hypothetical protein